MQSRARLIADKVQLCYPQPQATILSWLEPSNIKCADGAP